MLKIPGFPPNVVDNLSAGNRIDEGPDGTITAEPTQFYGFDNSDDDLGADVLPFWIGCSDRFFHTEADLGVEFEDDFFQVVGFFFGIFIQDSPQPIYFVGVGAKKWGQAQKDEGLLRFARNDMGKHFGLCCLRISPTITCLNKLWGLYDHV